MDIQLQELIDKIKKDGIDPRPPTRPGSEPKRRRRQNGLLPPRKKKRRSWLNGESGRGTVRKAGIAAVQQASRNLILSFKDEIQSLLNRIIERVCYGVVPGRYVENRNSRGFKSLGF